MGLVLRISDGSIVACTVLIQYQCITDTHTVGWTCPPRLLVLYYAGVLQEATQRLTVMNFVVTQADIKRSTNIKTAAIILELSAAQ